MITLVRDSSGDWIGLYKDGELVVDNHSLTEADVLRAVGIEFESYEIDLEEMPRYLTDLNLDEAERA